MSMADATSIERIREERDRAAHPELHDALSRTRDNLARVALVMRALDCDAFAAKAWLGARGYSARQDKCSHCSRVLGPRSCVFADRKLGLLYCSHACASEATKLETLTSGRQT